MRNIIGLLPWIIWIIGYLIYRKIKHKDVFDSNIYVPVMWVLCILGNAVNFIVVLCK